ncbi:MAG: hypothetical protein WBX15_17030, partial [Thermoanaerobaculia bacterium]
VRASALTARAERAQCSGQSECAEGAISGTAVRDVTYDRSPAGEKNAVLRASLARKWNYEHNRIGAIIAETLWKTDTQTNPMLRRTSYDVDPVLNYRSITNIVQTPQTATTTVTPTVINTRNQYASFGGETLGYDANGNLVRTAGAVLQYDAENHVAKATLADGTTLENLYDANGRKVEEVVTPAGQTPQTTPEKPGVRASRLGTGSNRLMLRELRSRSSSPAATSCQCLGRDARSLPIILGNVVRPERSGALSVPGLSC